MKHQPLRHDAYVWQRRWTPAVDAAIAASASRIGQWRVLGAEVSNQDGLVPVKAERSALVGTGTPVVVVIRINGQIGSWDRLGLVRRSLALVSEWRAARIPVVGLEIDHDCAAGRLTAYADFLAALRRAAGTSVRLSITALPSWLASPAVPALLRHVDEAVLQVHAVSHPSGGLFDPEQAAEWINRWARLTPVPFRIALPTYWSRVTWNAAGGIASVESEELALDVSPNSQEVIVRPQAVARLLDRLRRREEESLLGIVWFRLPLGTDKRAWTVGTWHAVIDGRPLGAAIAPHLVAASTPGTLDVYLANRGPIDDQLPREVQVSATGPCRAADATPPYAFVRDAGRVTFRLQSQGMLKAQRQRIAGWVRCEGEVSIHAPF